MQARTARPANPKHRPRLNLPHLALIVPNSYDLVKKKETGTSELCWSPPAGEAFRGPSRRAVAQRCQSSKEIVSVTTAILQREQEKIQRRTWPSPADPPGTPKKQDLQGVIARLRAPPAAGRRRSDRLPRPAARRECHPLAREYRPWPVRPGPRPLARRPPRAPARNEPGAERDRLVVEPQVRQAEFNPHNRLSSL